MIAFAWWRRHAAPIDRTPDYPEGALEFTPDGMGGTTLTREGRADRAERAKPRRLLRQVPLHEALREMMQNTRITVAPPRETIGPDDLGVGDVLADQHGRTYRVTHAPADVLRFSEVSDPTRFEPTVPTTGYWDPVNG